MALRGAGQARDQRERLLASGTPRGPRCLVACPQMIEAPHAASRHCEIEEHEAVDDSQLTRVQKRKEAPRRVRYEVCEGHVACQNERDRTSEQAVEAVGGNGCRQKPPMIFGLKTPPRRSRTLTAKGPLSGDALQTPISGLPEIGA